MELKDDDDPEEVEHEESEDNLKGHKEWLSLDKCHSLSLPARPSGSERV